MRVLICSIVLKIEQIVARDGDKAAGIRKKMEKIRKYVDDMLSSL
ncbi:MAG: hypothetical protein ACLVLP_06110 [Phascolarctobacterium faecium]